MQRRCYIVLSPTGVSVCSRRGPMCVDVRGVHCADSKFPRASTRSDDGVAQASLAVEGFGWFLDGGLTVCWGFG